jgi:hypothetical protein
LTRWRDDQMRRRLSQRYFLAVEPCITESLHVLGLAQPNWMFLVWRGIAVGDNFCNLQSCLLIMSPCGGKWHRALGRQYARQDRQAIESKGPNAAHTGCRSRDIGRGAKQIPSMEHPNGQAKILKGN